MSKTGYLKTICKYSQSVGGSAPKPPLASGGWGSVPDPDELFLSYIIATSKS